MTAEIVQYNGPTISTTSIDEMTPVETIFPRSVTVERKPCCVKSIFTCPDTPEIRELLERYHRREVLPIPARTLLILRADLYRRARAARGGL